jgi:diaminopimelate dehydrogenase
MSKIRVAISGYGNLGKGVESAIKQNSDMELCAVISRRKDLKINTSGVKIVSFDDVLSLKGEVDVVIICGGSATDLPEMTPFLAKHFTVVDSFDNHANIPLHREKVNESAKEGGNVAVISVGWDPGLFSVSRLYAESALPQGKSYTFWGKGVSQGHSDAIRRIDGVLTAKQYTVPREDAVESVRSGKMPELTTRDKHLRQCFVVPKDDADLEKIRETIVNMPNYFADYITTVEFISLEEFEANHSGIPHGGSVIRTGTTGEGNKSNVEFSLKLDSNPEFTGSVLVSFARAAYRMSADGVTGCKTIFDIPPALLSEKTPEELYATML